MLLFFCYYCGGFAVFKRRILDVINMSPGFQKLYISNTFQNNLEKCIPLCSTVLTYKCHVSNK